MSAAATAHEVVVTEFMDVAALAPLQARHAVHHDPALYRDPDAIAALAGSARALIVRNQTRVDAVLLARLPALRVLGRLGVGLDNIDLAACAARGIPVEAAVGTNDISVAEHTFAALLLLHKQAVRDSARIAAGDWPRQPQGSHELAGRTLGIVGLGRIGRRVAARALAFDMQVIASDPGVTAEDCARLGVEPVSLPQLLARSDALTLHCPLDDSTRGLLDAARLAQIKRGAVLVNTARGHIVDEAALIAALRSGQLGGAWLDVYAQEPVGRDNPFRDVPNLWLSAHTAGLTEQAYTRASVHVVERVAARLAEAAGGPASGLSTGLV